jgi:hypothetical protein
MNINITAFLVFTTTQLQKNSTIMKLSITITSAILSFAHAIPVGQDVVRLYRRTVADALTSAADTVAGAIFATDSELAREGITGDKKKHGVAWPALEKLPEQVNLAPVGHDK